MFFKGFLQFSIFSTSIEMFGVKPLSQNGQKSLGEPFPHVRTDFCDRVNRKKSKLKQAQRRGQAAAGWARQTFPSE